MSKLISAYFVLALVVFPTKGMCGVSQLCEPGASVVEQMNLQLAAGRKIDPVVLAGSIAFVEECPASVIPAFKRFAIDEQKLHRSWLEALKSGGERPPDGELRGFLALAKESVERDENTSLKEFLDGIFDVPAGTQELHRVPVESLFEQQSLATLRQFPRCDGAECNDVSDFLLFLLGTSPAAFFEAMHGDGPDATKWLSQLGDLSFAGDPSESKRRDSLRRFLLERISKSKAPESIREKLQCESVLRQIRFREWK